MQRRVRVGGVEVVADAHGLGRHRAEDRGAVRDRLVGRRAQLALRRARRRPGSTRAVVSRRSPRSPARPPAPPPRRRAPSATHRAISPLAVVGRRAERHVGDVDARAAERERDVGDDAGPVGHRRRAARGGAAGPSPASTSARALARRPRPARRVEVGARRAAARGPPRARRCAPSSASASASRLARVDAAPQRRVGAGDARRVAEARAGGAAGARRRARRAAWATRTLATTCGRWLTRGHHAVVGVGVDRRRAARRGR